MDADEATRVRQGACETTSPDILRQLATDPSVTVRASLALNPALPDQVISILQADTDVRVRTILSRKLAALTPTLSEDARQRVQQDAVASLTAMVAEAALRIRASIADSIRDMPDGPREIILRLAHDPAVMVCEPVIQFSPMLTQEDLVALIASGPPATTVMAVASRPRIGPAVSDAIVGCADTAAICALLRNHTAQIREATLDALAAQSEDHTDWQEPLVRRPHLPVRAQRMLAEIVTGHLLDTLASRDDLDPKVGSMLRAALERNRQIYPDAAAGRTGRTADPDPDATTAFARARALDQAGRVDDHAILEALRRNAALEARAMLAVKAGVAVPVIEHACSLRSAKAVVSLAWKAGFSAQTAVVLQAMLGRLAPDEILRPGPDTAFPLSEDEMRWQLAFLGAGEGGTRTWMPRRLP
jgi:uncharacterized protein (DUF2336 family)